jgi:hypothetical protein
MHSRAFAKRILASSLLILFTGCTQSGGDSQTSSTGLTLNTKPDAELFATSKDASENLKQEIKRQFLLAASQSGIMKHIAGSSAGVVLSEIAIAPVEKSTQQIEVSITGKIDQRTETTPAAAPLESVPVNKNSRNLKNSVPQNKSALPPLDIGNLGAGIQTAYHVSSSTYNITFIFQEKKPDGGEEEVFILQLKNPLQVEEEISIASRVKLSIAAIKALPQGLAAIAARLFDDIVLQIDAGNTFKRTSEISTRMYFKNKSGEYTELMRDFTTDIVQPLCRKIVVKNGTKEESCGVQLPSMDNPLQALEARLANFVAKTTQCEKTALSENFLPIYKLYFAIPSAIQAYTPEARAFLFESVNGGWKKMGWGTILGQSALETCQGAKENEQCLILKYGAQFFDEKCKSIRDKNIQLGIYHEDKPAIYIK